MTVTKDDLETGKTLHGEWNQAKEVRAQNAKVERAHSDPLWAHCCHTEGACVRFWLRHGEEVLAALEEAWDEEAALRRHLEEALMRLGDDIGILRNLHDNSEASLSVLIPLRQRIRDFLRAAEEGE